MQRCNTFVVILLLLSTHLTSQDIDCKQFLSTGSQDSLNWYGVGVHSSKNIDILKENAITDLVFKINAKVDASLNVQVDEKIENQKKKLFRRKNRKEESLKKQAQKSTTISSEIEISDYTFSNIKKCGNDYVISVSLNKAALKESMSKEASVFIDKARVVVSSKGSIASRLNDIDDLYKDMSEFSTRLSIIDIKTIQRFNTSLHYLRNAYRDELSTITVSYNFNPSLVHDLNRDSTLNLEIANTNQTIFENTRIEVVFGGVKNSIILDSNSSASLSVQSEAINNLTSFDLTIDLEDDIKNDILFKSLNLTDPTFSKIIKRNKMNVFTSFSCDQDVKTFIDKDYIRFIDKLTNNYQIKFVDTAEAADLIIDIDCLRENVRKNSYDIYILQFQLSGKTNLYGSEESIVMESVFLDEKSFSGYKKAYSNMSSDLLKFFNELYGKIENLLL